MPSKPLPRKKACFCPASEIASLNKLIQSKAISPPITYNICRGGQVAVGTELTQGKLAQLRQWLPPTAPLALDSAAQRSLPDDHGVIDARQPLRERGPRVSWVNAPPSTPASKTPPFSSNIYEVSPSVPCSR